MAKEDEKAFETHVVHVDISIINLMITYIYHW